MPGSSAGGTVTALAGGPRTFGAAVDTFLSQPWPATTARTYGGTLERLAAVLGRDRPPARITDEKMAEAATVLWGNLAARTWNRHLATVGSFLAWCRRHGWPSGELELHADRRAEPGDDTKAIPLPELQRLWSRAGIPAPGAGAVAAAVRLRLPAPRRPSVWTCPTSTSATGRHALTLRAATSGRCTSRPAPPGCLPSSPPTASPARCSSHTGGPPPTA